MQPISIEHAERRLRAALDVGDRDAIEQWGELVDLLDVRLPPPSLADAARWYSSLGLHVFPLSARSKKPLPRSNGLHDATTDQRTIAQWWGERADRNVGIATGHVVDVLDVDGIDGELSLSQLVGDHDELGIIRDRLGVVGTPRPGGRHFYYAASGLGNTQGLFPHIDRRGIGGYVVAPPSFVETPDYSGTYVWHRLLDVSALRPGKA